MELSYDELYKSTLESRKDWSEAKISAWFKQRIENRKAKLSAICFDYSAGVQSRKQLLA